MRNRPSNNELYIATNELFRRTYLEFILNGSNLLLPYTNMGRKVMYTWINWVNWPISKGAEKKGILSKNSPVID